jgi:hypothetical protein
VVVTKDDGPRPGGRRGDMKSHQGAMWICGATSTSMMIDATYAKNFLCLKNKQVWSHFLILAIIRAE